MLFPGTKNVYMFMCSKIYMQLKHYMPLLLVMKIMMG